MKYVFVMLLLVLPLAFCFSAVVEMPPRVLRGMEDFNKDVAKATADLIKVLEREEERATKDGNLDLALAIRAKRTEAAASLPKAAAAECAVVLQYDGSATVEDLVDGVTYLSNRSVKLGAIPDNLKGLKFTKLQGHDVHALTISAHEAGNCFLLIDARYGDAVIASLAKRGWTAAGSLAVADPMGSFKVYAKALKKGEVVNVPATSGGWISVVLAAPRVEIVK